MLVLLNYPQSQHCPDKNQQVSLYLRENIASSVLSHYLSISRMIVEQIIK